MEARYCQHYARVMSEVTADFDWTPVTKMAESLWECWESGGHLYLCGNGGSAANAVHLANDLLYGIDPEGGKGMKVEALSANTSVLTCLANDTSYAEIFSRQIEAKGGEGDVLLVFSGSGNSDNVVRAIESAKSIGIPTFAVLGFEGGKCLELADTSIHFPINDMQIAEDLQMVVGHIIMKWLKKSRAETKDSGVQ